MIIIQSGENLLHNGLSEKRGLFFYAKIFTIGLYRSHFTIIQINHLPMAAYHCSLLLLQIFRIDR